MFFCAIFEWQVIGFVVSSGDDLYYNPLFIYMETVRTSYCTTNLIQILLTFSLHFPFTVHFVGKCLSPLADTHCKIGSSRYGEKPNMFAISLDGVAIVAEVRRPDNTETTTHAKSSHADGQCNQERPRPPCCMAAGFSPAMHKKAQIVKHI
jgi:hypothetical protein